MAAAVLATAAMACPREGPQETGDAESGIVESKTIEEVLAERTPVWMKAPGVVGTGIGLCADIPCIVVYVSERTPEVGEIPDEVDGHRVRIEETGPIRALDPEDDG